MRRNILSINGNKSMNFLLMTVLSSNCNFIAVSDMFQAMEEIKRNENIDLTIIDLDYHTEENVDFIQHIQTSSLYQGMPFIILSSDRNFLGTEIDLNGCSVFYKPFSPMDIISKVQDLVQRKYEKVS